MAVAMIGRTHLTTGFTAGAWTSAVCETLGVPDLWALAAAVPVIVGSIAPDIDSPRSLITFSLGPVTMLLSWILRGMPLDGLGVHRELSPLRVTHRGFTHRPEGWLAAGLVTAVVTWFLPGELGGYSWLWGIGMFVGCAVHVWGDAHTLSGAVLRRGGDPVWVVRRPFVTGGEDGVEDDLRWSLYVPVAVASWIAATAIVFSWQVATALVLFLAWRALERSRRRRWARV